tara:strand:+ start:64 stop:327 length:264 start_codon:yes stop_codon:yes gene_type:complete
MADTTAGGIKEVENRITAEFMMEAVTVNLSDREHKLLQWRLDGMTYKEMGEADGVSGGRAGQLLQRAYRKMRWCQKLYKLDNVFVDR